MFFCDSEIRKLDRVCPGVMDECSASPGMRSSLSRGNTEQVRLFISTMYFKRK